MIKHLAEFAVYIFPQNKHTLFDIEEVSVYLSDENYNVYIHYVFTHCY